MPEISRNRQNARYAEDVVNVKDFGAAGDGVTDDASAWQSAANVGGTIYAEGTYLIGSPVVFSNPVKIIGSPTIIPAIGLAGGKVLAFETDDVDVQGLTFDGTGQTFTPATGTTYCIFGGDGTTKFFNHTYRNNKFVNCSFSDGLSGTSNLIVTHATYVDNVDNVSIDDNYFNALSGAAVFVRDINNLSCRNNDITDSVWYPIHLVGGINGFDVSNNKITSDISSGVFYGGGIDIMSQQTPLEARNKNGIVSQNVLTGTYSYGSAIRVLSCENIDIFGNTIEDVSVGSTSLSPSLTGIRIDTRGISAGTENGPVKNISVYNNRISSGLTGANEHIGIYLSNQWQTSRTPAEFIKIYGNEIISTDTSNYWESGILVHGFEGGVEDLYIQNNKCVVNMQSGPIVDGAIGLVATNSQGSINRAHIGGNRVVDLGTPASSYQLGIGYGAYVDEVYQSSPNLIDNFFYGIRTFANSGTVLDTIDNNYYENIGSLNELYAVNPSRYGLYLEASTTYDPPSLASGAYTFTDVAVTGAEIGDRVEATFSLNQDGVIFTGYVRVANSVRVYLENKDASVKDLASGTLTVRVYR